jgi:hypothetical protein
MTPSGFQKTELVRTRSGHGSKRPACPSIACRSAGGVLRANLATFRRDDPQTAMISAATSQVVAATVAGMGPLRRGMSPAWQQLFRRRSGSSGQSPYSAEQRLGGDLNSRDQSDLHGHPNLFDRRLSHGCHQGSGG